MPDFPGLQKIPGLQKFPRVFQVFQGPYDHGVTMPITTGTTGKVSYNMTTYTGLFSVQGLHYPRIWPLYQAESIHSRKVTFRLQIIEKWFISRRGRR